MEKNTFKMLSMYFCYIVIISTVKRQGLSFEQTWISFMEEYFESSLIEIGPVILDFLLFQNYLPLKKDIDLCLNKLEFLSPMDALC